MASHLCWNGLIKTNHKQALINQRIQYIFLKLTDKIKIFTFFITGLRFHTEVVAQSCTVKKMPFGLLSCYVRFQIRLFPLLPTVCVMFRQSKAKEIGNQYFDILKIHVKFR